MKKIITEQEYRKALQVVKAWEKQQQNKKPLTGIKVVFDDSLYTIEYKDIEIKMGYHEYSEILPIILTEKQYEIYIGDDREREFLCSKKRIQEARKYLKSESNFWQTYQIN